MTPRPRRSEGAKRPTVVDSVARVDPAREARLEPSASRHIVFSHANGFPAGTYRQIFDAWRAAGWQVHAIEKIGHDPRFPVTDDWPHLRAQLVAFIERAVGGPAFLVGHSLGGYLSLMAALHRPALAAGVVMLDSPLFAGWRAGAVRFMKTTGIGERYSPANASRRRRQHWQSAAAAHSHFAAKAAFARWSDGVLDDYIRSGIEPQGTEHRLAFDRDVETAIYRTLPDRLARGLRDHPPRCPVAFVRGTESKEIRLAGLHATEQLVGDRLVAVRGSHLYPFERPAETAAAVLGLLGGMTDLRPPANL